MIKNVYYCDICEKETPQEKLQKMKFPFTFETQEGTSLEIKEFDCCLNCCFNLAMLLKNTKFLHYPEVEKVEGEIVE